MRKVWLTAELCARMPLRHSSLIGKPASASVMKPMICASANLLFLMPAILQIDELHYHYAGTAEGVMSVAPNSGSQ